MKTTILTIIVLFTVTMNTLHAGGLRRGTMKPEPSGSELSIDIAKLAPSTPAFAEFTDESDLTVRPAKIVNQLAPSTPVEADFDDCTESHDMVLEKTVVHAGLAPVPPTEVNFSE